MKKKNLKIGIGMAEEAKLRFETLQLHAGYVFAFLIFLGLWVWERWFFGRAMRVDHCVGF